MSLLARSGGLLVAELLDGDALVALQAEAEQCAARAETYHVPRDDGQQVRGGSPDRWFASAVGGPRLQALYGWRRLVELLERVTDRPWRPSGGEGTYTYYRRPGHHLGIHRDVEECDLAVIVCVAESWRRDPGLAGTLCAYPTRVGEPLSAIRARRDSGAVHVRLRPGEAALLLGGAVPHRVVPIASGQARVVAPLCFTPLS